jgi:hypothetical protein
MLVFSMSQLLSLARIYAGYSGTTLGEVGKQATGHWALFPRLADGCGCSAKAAQMATLWFLANWPEDLDWPKHIPDLRELIDA